MSHAMTARSISGLQFVRAMRNEFNSYPGLISRRHFYAIRIACVTLRKSGLKAIGSKTLTIINRYNPHPEPLADMFIHEVAIFLSIMSAERCKFSGENISHVHSGNREEMENSLLCPQASKPTIFASANTAI